MFVIRNTKTGAYLKGGKTSYSVQWVNNINQARVYGRKCDAKNSIIGHYPAYTYRTRYNPTNTLASDLEVVEVNVSVSNSSDPNIKVDISPEILEHATRFMMTEQAKKAEAPKALLDSFDSLDTNTLVKLVTTLYGRK